MLAQLNTGPGKELVAWNSAALYDMIYTQPIIYELGNISVATVLMIGDKDNTAIGKDFSPPAVRALLGHYPELGKSAARRIPHAKLIQFPDLGHAPQIQDPVAFHSALSVRAQVPSATDLGGFAGHWACKGHFESNGAAIAGELSIEADERSGSLVVHHDDVAPDAYHALEV